MLQDLLVKVVANKTSNITPSHFAPVIKNKLLGLARSTANIANIDKYQTPPHIDNCKFAISNINNIDGNIDCRLKFHRVSKHKW